MFLFVCDAQIMNRNKHKFEAEIYSSKDFLTVNSIWGGGTTPLTENKFVKKKANAIRIIFHKCYQNPLRQLLKQISKLYQLWESVT